MKWTWKTILIGVLIIAAFFYFLMPKRRVRHRRHHSPAIRHYRKRRSQAERRASFKPRSRGRKGGSRKMIRLGNRMLTPKQWGAAMQRRRRRA